jgi:hypothetical protein
MFVFTTINLNLKAACGEPTPQSEATS